MAFFSIIVAALNAEKTIEDTIQSVLRQSFRDYEIIVKDGASVDDTVKRIPCDERIKTVVKKDNGIYQGMNQGIEVATGEYCCFLNCGDSFYNDNVLENVHDFIMSSSKKGIFYGNYYTKGDFVKTPSVTSRFSIFRNPLCHQTMFINRELFQRLGLYHEDYRILADYEFTVHCVNEMVPCVNTEVTVCNYLGGGVSTQKKYRETIDNEYKRIKEQYFTSEERIKYNLKIMVTLPKLRAYLASDKSPKIAHKVYNMVANKYKT